MSRRAVREEKAKSSPSEREDAFERAYRVETPLTVSTDAPAPEPPGIRKFAPGPRARAVFGIHGMGRQIQFQTVDQILKGLRREDARKRGISIDELPKPGFRRVEIAGEQLTRIELKLHRGGGTEQDVHLYEAYWAPLTEGAVHLRDVIAFLYRGALNGVRLAIRSGVFKRWLFEEYPRIPVPVNAVVSMLLALLVAVSLVVLNSTVALVVAARSPLMKRPEWLTDSLFSDLSTTMNLFLFLWIAFVVFLGLTVLGGNLGAPRFVRRLLNLVSLVHFAAGLAATILAALAIPLLFYAHFRCAPPGSVNSPARAVVVPPFWTRWFDAGFLEGFNRIFETLLALLVAGAVAWVVLALAVRLIRSVRRLFEKSSPYRSSRAAGALMVGSFIGLIISIGVVTYGIVSVAFDCLPNGYEADLRVSWPILLAGSAYARFLLVQFPGDVAAYVESHTLDRFADLRAKIKDCVLNKARAVYGATREDGSSREYEQVIMVGHSLGSVIAYDTLNRLINDDERAKARAELLGDPLAKNGKAERETKPDEGPSLDVVDRTPLLLTSGSPLDKTAFVFAIQRRKTSQAREAAASTLQPLIRSYANRPKEWINVYSPWDIISGSLELYDSPPKDEKSERVRDAPEPTSEEDRRKRVQNLADDEASTLLLAHNEYYDSGLMFGLLHARLTA